MLSAAKERNLVADRDGLRSLPEEVRRALRVETLASLPEEGILDTHLSIRTPHGLEPAVPMTLRPWGKIVLLEAPPALILDRRQSRVGRADFSDSLETIEAQQVYNRAYALQPPSQGVTVLDASRSIVQVAAMLRELLMSQ
jgi:adenylate kinase